MEIQVELGELAQNMRLVSGAIDFNVDERRNR
jgi:hypothetical protein